MTDQPRHCLVTGGAGFIGSHLTQRLLDLGHRVTVVDNLATGRLENLAHLANNNRLTVAQLDAGDLDRLRPVMTGVDWVFHLAALADIVPSIENPLAYHRANVDATVTVLEAARAAGVKRFVYTASSSCYGLATTFPTPETAPICPMYPYALSKYLGEQIAMHWAQCYRMPIVALRLFNVYGPRSRTNGTYGAVFGVFLAQKLAGKPFTIVGDGTQKRDFTFVTDVAEAFVKAARSDVAGQVYNVGSGGAYSINHLVDLLGGEKTHIPKRPGEPECTFADTRRIRTELGWSPKVSFEQGVATMLRHIDQYRSAPVWDQNSIADATRDWFKYLGAA
ncbi:MAG: SDR family oxidoreductase [Phycisphaeraceae bacterium]